MTSQMIIASKHQVEPLQCLICQSISFEPFCCGYCCSVICVECLRAWGTENSWACPNANCRRYIDPSSLSVHSYILGAIHNLAARCPKGCGFEGALAKVTEHAASCNSLDLTKEVKLLFLDLTFFQLLKTQRHVTNCFNEQKDVTTNNETLTDGRSFMFRILKAHFQETGKGTFNTNPFTLCGESCKMIVTPLQWAQCHSFAAITITFSSYINKNEQVKLTFRVLHRSDKNQDLVEEVFIPARPCQLYANVHIGPYIENKEDLVHDDGRIYFVVTMEKVPQPERPVKRTQYEKLKKKLSRLL
jgi:hypothetical protein